MNILLQAQEDTRKILNDQATGFAVAIFVTNLVGFRKEFSGFSNDIADLIDPETGQAANSRLVSVALSIQDLFADGFTTELPRGINKKDSKAWLVDFTDLLGLSTKWKVFKSNPDYGIGMVTLLLERWKDAP